MKKTVLLEVRRQVTHLCFGIVLTLFLFLNIIDGWFLAGATCAFSAFILYWKSEYGQRCIFKRILSFFEREEHILKFPGRGLFFFLLSAFLVVIIFPKSIALASILILSIGDSFSHLYGRFLGKWKVPLRPDKNIDGHIFAAFFSALAATAFVPFFPAFFSSIIAMIVEIPSFHLGKIPLDDNLLIPLVSASALFVWNMYFPFL